MLVLRRIASVALLAVTALIALPDCDASSSPSPSLAATPAFPVERAPLPRLVIHRNRFGVAQRLWDGDSVRPGDVIQVSYVATEDPTGVVVSVDGSGSVTLHYPPSLGDEPTLQRGGLAPLDHAFELDDAPEFERFFLVTSSDVPTDVELVILAAQELAASECDREHDKLGLPSLWHQQSLTLRKVP